MSDVGHDVVVHDAVVVEPSGDEMSLERGGKVTLCQYHEQEDRSAVVGIRHAASVVRGLDELVARCDSRQGT